MSSDTTVTVPQLPQGTLLEGVVTTLNVDNSPHIAPMGPIIESGFTRIHLRPYQTSTTYQNLKRSGQGVLHVTDDVELFARAAVGRLETSPRTFASKAVEGVILADACRWHAFRVDSIDDREERTSIVASIVEYGRMRDFFGFNRAKHAVIEAAILATRIDFLDMAHIRSEYKRLAVLVEKTGGQQEHGAFDFLQQFLDERCSGASHAEAAG